MKKNAIYLTFSIIFLALSALGISWLIKQEIEKGKQENQSQKSATAKRMDPGEEESRDSRTKSEIVVENRQQASDALDDVESLMNSADEGDLAENQVK